MNALRKLSPVAVLTLVGSQAYAALPAGAETAITTMQTDVVTAIGLVIAAGIAIYAVRKLGQKMGWL